MTIGAGRRWPRWSRWPGWSRRPTWSQWRSWLGWWSAVRRLGLLVAVGVAVASTPSRSLAGTILGLAGVAAGWFMWTFAVNHPKWVACGLVLTGASGVLLCLTNPRGVALAYPMIACLRAGVVAAPRWSIGLTLVLSAALGAGGWLLHGDPAQLLLGPVVMLVSLSGGLIRRQNLRLHQEADLARAEQSALAERARIAREIHDVLAHTLAALTVQLETADALLEGGRAGPARELVVRAGQLARDGLAETRRAIGALRGETLPLPELLRALGAGYRADLGAPATVTVDGQPRDLDGETGLALYRAAQEAITNVRKHASGAPVEVALAYRAADVDLTVVNGPPQDGTGGLADTGGGYGLAGLRERAELAGGEFSAGRHGDGWRVDVRIPT